MATNAIRFGVVAGALSADPREASRLSRQMGFTGLLFDAASGATDLTQLSGSGRREFRHMLASQDQELAGLRAAIGPRGFGPGADVDRVIARLEQIMEAAVAIGGPLVCIDLGPLPPAPYVPKLKPKLTQQQAGLILLPEADVPPPPPEPPPSPPDPAFVAQVDAALSELGRRADRYSAILAFRSELSSLASLRRAIVNANCPWFGIDLDPVAMLQDAWGADEVFSQLGGLVRAVRARDAIAGADRRTQAVPIGHGSVQWETLLGNLDEAGYRGWANIDSTDLTDRPAAARTGLKTLRAAAE